MNCDQDLLRARVFHGLKSRVQPQDTLDPRYLEITVCSAMGLDHVGDGNWYADGVGQGRQLSVKTRSLTAQILKRTNSGRDFHTDPDRYLGAQTNQRQGMTWQGMEFVQRRQQIPRETELTAREIGVRTLWGFRQNQRESSQRYQCRETWEAICVHGYAWTGLEYLINVYWGPARIPRPHQWQQTAGGVTGLDSQGQIICHRVRGGAPREATCYKEYKDPRTLAHRLELRVPVPPRDSFDLETCLREMDNFKPRSGHGSGEKV